MGYIAKTYITRLSEDILIELLNKLKQLGYKNCRRGRYDNALALERGEAYSFDNDIIVYAVDSIRCNAYTPNGTEEEATKLFLELSKMQDNESGTSWWVAKNKNGSKYIVEANSQIEVARKIEECGIISIERLTPLEVAEAYRDGEIKL